MNTRKLVFPFLVVALGACAAGTEPMASDGEDSLGEGSFDMAKGADAAGNAALQGTPMMQQGRVEVMLQATNSAGEGVALFGCETFRVAAGTAGASHFHAPAIQTDPTGEGPSCTMTPEANMQLAIAETSESYISLHSSGMGGYATQITTDKADESAQRVRYRLLSHEQLSAAGIEPSSSSNVVVVETPADGMTIELLLGGSAQGPAPIYLDEDGHAGELETTVAGGWVAFVQVPSGMHTLSFGHPTLRCTQAPGFGWAGTEAGLSQIIAIQGSTNIVAGITCD